MGRVLLDIGSGDAHGFREPQPAQQSEQDDALGPISSGAVDEPARFALGQCAAVSAACRRKLDVTRGIGGDQPVSLGQGEDGIQDLAEVADAGARQRGELARKKCLQAHSCDGLERQCP